MSPSRSTVGWVGVMSGARPRARMDLWTQRPGRQFEGLTVTSVTHRLYTSKIRRLIWRSQHGVPARLRCAHGLDRQGAEGSEPQSRGRGERHPEKRPVLVSATAGARSPSMPQAREIRIRLTYRWFFYSEAGTGVPGQPVAQGPPVPIGGGGVAGEGGIPSGPAGGPREPPARVTLTGETSLRVTVTPRVAGTAHIILAVEDGGTPALTSYRRVIVTIRANDAGCSECVLRATGATVQRAGTCHVRRARAVCDVPDVRRATSARRLRRPRRRTRHEHVAPSTLHVQHVAP